MQWRWASIAVEAILLEVYNLSILISQAIFNFLAPAYASASTNPF